MAHVLQAHKIYLCCMMRMQTTLAGEPGFGWRCAKRVLSSATVSTERVFLRRPVEDLLARIKLTVRKPSIASLQGMRGALPLLHREWAELDHVHTVGADLPGTDSFDLVLTGTHPKDLGQLENLLERVSPGGWLAMVVHLGSLNPSHSRMCVGV